MRLLHLQIENCQQCPYMAKLSYSEFEPDEGPTTCGLLTILKQEQVKLNLDQAINNVHPECPLPSDAQYTLLSQSELMHAARGAAVKLNIALKHRVITSLDWMLRYVKWKYRQEKNIPDGFPDSEVDWSDEVKTAIQVYEELCQ